MASITANSVGCGLYPPVLQVSEVMEVPPNHPILGYPILRTPHIYEIYVFV